MDPDSKRKNREGTILLVVGWVFLKSESGTVSPLAGAGLRGGMRLLLGGLGVLAALGPLLSPGSRREEMERESGMEMSRLLSWLCRCCGTEGPCSCLCSRDKDDIGGGGFLQGLSGWPWGAFPLYFLRTQSQGCLVFRVYPGWRLTPVHLPRTSAGGGVLGRALGHLWVPPAPSGWGTGWWVTGGAGPQCCACSGCRGSPTASMLLERR